MSFAAGLSIRFPNSPKYPERGCISEEVYRRGLFDSGIISLGPSSARCFSTEVQVAVSLGVR